MTLITENYRILNRELHRTNQHYGTSGQKWAVMVSKLAANMKALNILDYGCGRGTLARALPDLQIVNYDPALVGLDDLPGQADLVVCTDVLEHIEPECLDDVLDDLKRCTGRKAFLVVATRPAKKFLADGRNAHLIQASARWWLEHIEPECLDDVLDDLKRCTGRKAFFVVATRPAKKFLADGRNAHLIQASTRWWLEQLLLRWDLEAFQDFGGEFLAIMRRIQQ